MCYRMSLGTGRPIVLRDESSVRHCRILLNHRMASVTDIRLIALVEMVAQKSEDCRFQHHRPLLTFLSPNLRNSFPHGEPSHPQRHCVYSTGKWRLGQLVEWTRRTSPCVCSTFCRPFSSKGTCRQDHGSRITLAKTPGRGVALRQTLAHLPCSAWRVLGQDELWAARACLPGQGRSVQLPRHFPWFFGVQVSNPAMADGTIIDDIVSELLWDTLFMIAL